VNSSFAVAALILFVSLMLVLPLIPAFVELTRKSDASPLKVVQQHAGEIRHFASSFRTYIQVLEPTLQQCVASGATARGMLPDGVEYLALGQCNDSQTLPIRQPGAICPVTIAAGSDLVVPPETTFLRDVYAGGRFSGGDNNSYRAILGEKDVHLGCSSRVTRWVHAVGEFSAEHDCKLSGRVSSDSCIRLQGACNFLRLNAPQIETGHVLPGEDSTRAHSDDNADAGSDMVQRLLYDGDFEVHADEDLTGNIVARSKLHIGSAARIRGSVKSVSDMVLGAGVSVDSCIRPQGAGNVLRLNTAQIETGRVMPAEDSTRPRSEDDANAGSGVVQRFLYDGDFEIYADEVVTGNIVARGKLRIGSGARIRGSVKSVRDMVLGAGVSVHGSLISGEQMLIGPDCAVNGPIIAERALHISAGTRCGSFQHPTTVSAPRIEAEEGVVVFGTLWAREHGEVVASR